MTTVRDALRKKTDYVGRYTLANFSTKTRGDTQLIVVKHLDSFLTKSKCLTTINQTYFLLIPQTRSPSRRVTDSTDPIMVMVPIEEFWRGCRPEPHCRLVPTPPIRADGSHTFTFFMSRSNWKHLTALFVSCRLTKEPNKAPKGCQAYLQIPKPMATSSLNRHRHSPSSCQ